MSIYLEDKKMAKRLLVGQERAFTQFFVDPGNVEHQCHRHGHGLLMVEGNAGGKTVYTDLVDYISP